MTQWARTITGDMLLPTRGNGAAALVTDPMVCAAIKIPSVLQFVRGEWALDQSLGFPWLGIWGQKNPSITGIRQLIRKTVLGIPPVASVLDVSAAYNPSLRNLQYAIVARLSSGQTVSVP